ncbi:hypothetical protein GTCCBUS3UF5_24610 [Geobacillus thermoleovorans CCB_US3_UF5]|nr:hypothetical protein GTCCBUS3UF5_24610 [Geobacillus thermoleovorans CCB_US3_UF5]AMV11316.1 hypothetical protein GT3570_10340 [Geobacillus thermoleovorans]GAJ58485.1 hypothetical protein B23_1691 [Geobacillus thermoleovorans B23]
MTVCALPFGFVGLAAEVRRSTPFVIFAVFVLLPEPPACISNKICAAQEETTKMESKIEVLATVKVQHSDDLYKIVDCLNRTLKRDNLMFGLALDENDKRQAIFTIYRT